MKAEAAALQADVRDGREFTAQLEDRATQAEEQVGQAWLQFDAAKEEVRDALAAREGLETEAAALAASLREAEGTAARLLQEYAALEDLSSQEHSRCQEYQALAAQAEEELHGAASEAG